MKKEIKQPKASRDFEALKTLLKISKNQHNQFMLSLLIIALSNSCAALGAYLMSFLIENGLRASHPDYAFRMGAWVLLCEIAFIGLYYLGRRILAQASLKCMLEIREKLFIKLEQLPMSYFDKEPVGRTVTRLTHDVENLENFFSASMPRILSSLLSIFVVSIAMLLTNFVIGSILFVTIIPAIALTVLYREPLRQMNRAYSHNNSIINSKLNEFLNGIPVIRAFGLEDWSKKEFDLQANKFLKAALGINLLNSWIRPTVSLLATLPLLGLILWAAPKVIAGTFAIGLFVTFLRYSERFYRPIYTISQEVHQIQTAFAYLERVLTLLNETEEDKILIQGPLKIKNNPWKIEFKNLWMKYEDSDSWILENFNLEIAPKEKVGFVGRTGSGKTSTVSLLARLHPFQKGELLINDIPIQNYERSSLRAGIGFVSQDVVIFQGSLRENLCFGKSYSDRILLKACEESGLLQVMRRNNLGLESNLLNRGENLSVGERQLLSLTRIFLIKPSLLILDEATANIDEKLEALIQSALAEILKNSTSIIIAHRLKTLELCDNVISFKNHSSHFDSSNIASAT